MIEVANRSQSPAGIGAERVKARYLEGQRDSRNVCFRCAVQPRRYHTNLAEDLQLSECKALPNHNVSCGYSYKGQSADLGMGKMLLIDRPTEFYVELDQSTFAYSTLQS